MSWLYPFSSTEWGIVGVFGLLYVYYFVRSFRLARLLNVTPWAVVPKFVLRSGALAMLLIALLGPLFGETTHSVSAQGRDVFVVLDVSRSMDAADVAPTRLERAKFAVGQLLDSLSRDRFGLILVSDDAFLLSPLTTDRAALGQLLRAVQAEPTGGSSLCAALELARQKLLTDSTTQTHTQAVVLVSDGENFGPCAPTMLTQFRQYGVALLAVGMGTDAGGPIREGSAYVKDEQGQIAHTRLNRDWLRALVRNTPGYYFDGTDGVADQVASALRSLPGRTIDQRRLAVSTNKYYYFLGVALVLIALDVLITVRTFRL
ncbi:VWA domain-containing protein [Fibrella sp. HMF5335]|uniref:VWA domain-containing protein n=1 Tax=Fibrella rubiginis TaxID=2817060 RepID=A0A939GJV3_9BACT|nr:VWA domain-containing protein [Fibrella rubiginis]MBO0939661.1 VWA domain-containing protein [Fibrella rubiginis]